jgi:phage baseplate assembly protein W
MPELREALEAAIEKVEAPEQPAATAPAPEPEQPAVEPEAPETPAAEPEAPPAEPEKPEEPEKPTEPEKPQTEQEKLQQRFSMDRPPQSWRTPEAKNAWRHVPRAAREEIIRRERETMRVLGESGVARQVANRFTEVIRPYEARMRSLNIEPMAAIDELLKADHLLTTSNPTKKAQLVATIIKEYGVDIRELDNVLSGEPVGDPVADKIEQLVQQRLQPFQQFVQGQAQAAARARAAEQQQIAHTVETMASDPRFPHFGAVRNIMADIVEAAGNRGLAMPLEEAYKRAVAVYDPRLAVAQSQPQPSAAAAANQRAQRALNASVSVGGAPMGAPAAGKAGDLRSTLEAAFESVSGR